MYFTMDCKYGNDFEKTKAISNIFPKSIEVLMQNTTYMNIK